MGLFRGAVFRDGGGALKQPIKQTTETPTSTLALMGRFPTLMGRFNRFRPKGPFFPLENPLENSPFLRKGALRGSWKESAWCFEYCQLFFSPVFSWVRKGKTFLGVLGVVFPWFYQKTKEWKIRVTFMTKALFPPPWLSWGQLLNKACGSPSFIAPELVDLDGRSYDGAKACLKCILLCCHNMQSLWDKRAVS